MTRTLLGYAFTVEWALYLGGALFMELVWRPVQRHLPPAGTGALCSAMGRRYRWLALGALATIAATGIALDLSPPAGTRAGSPWRPVALLATWAALVAVVAAMGLALHPGSHARLGPGGDPDAHRRRRLRALRAMDALLRAELALALAGALLASWPARGAPGWAV
jgi:uncharacterized membrane protein